MKAGSAPQSRAEATVSPFGSPRPEASASVLPVPEYEEIQELRQTRSRNNTEELGSRADYEFTKCPAYAVTTSVQMC